MEIGNWKLKLLVEVGCWVTAGPRPQGLGPALKIKAGIPVRTYTNTYSTVAT